MKTVSITSKGQITIPASARQQLGIQSADQLEVEIHPETRTLSLRKPLTVDEFVAYIDSLPESNVKPLEDVDAYYQKHREPRL